MKRHILHRTMMSKTGFMGVVWEADKQKFRAVIGYAGKRYRLGRFKTAEEAAHAYDQKARLLMGEKAYLNFPAKHELKVMKSKKHLGRCPEGHLYAVHGTPSRRGGVLCRICNQAANRKHRAYQEMRP